ncbi:HAMP domain-containing histidine kinase [Aquincola sp. S2]|uniref:histidine kinase n=1 Tax=Pseudaquabacterium terrae TaxID=2732868 RepID=A0ABX2ERP7_9BURK|nr:HAMP domain-containing sensor histidine kinase [Aquabacterium terrae]NRF71273.1 HAMP domain-containing histidine kinase [Aquabacterium terrae]
MLISSNLPAGGYVNATETKMHDRLLTRKDADGVDPDGSAGGYQRRWLGSDARPRVEPAQRLAEEAVALVSHELRSPLAAVANWAQVLQRSPEDRHTVLRAAVAIERCVRLQAALVDDLLDMTRIGAGKLELTQAELELDGVIQASLAMVEHAAEAKRISLRREASEPLRFRADARRLQQVLVNLLTNAIKFTPEGGQVCIRSFEQGSHAFIHVADSGEGIEAALLPFIFERFQQARTAEERRGGIGLGLHLAKRLVELHGGSIHAKSAGPGLGAEFTVRLPCMGAPEANRA